MKHLIPACAQTDIQLISICNKYIHIIQSAYGTERQLQLELRNRSIEIQVRTFYTHKTIYIPYTSPLLYNIPGAHKTLHMQFRKNAIYTKSPALYLIVHGLNTKPYARPVLLQHIPLKLSKVQVPRCMCNYYS